MYWLENIDRYIEHFASPAIQQRGKTLFNIGGVRSIEYDTEGNKGKVDISSGELFTVTITNGVNQDFRNIVTSCDCDYKIGVCKHAVAAMYGLKKKFQYNSAAIINIIRQSAGIHNSSTELELTDDLIQKYSSDTQYPPRVRDLTEMTIKYKVLSQNLLSFEVGSKIMVREKSSYKYETVDILIAPSKLTTRCSCNVQVLDLCEHQMKVTRHFIIELQQGNLLKSFPNLTDLKAKAVEEYGLASEDDIEKFFALTLTSKGPTYIPNDKDLVSFSDHQFLSKKLEQISETSPYNALGISDNTEDNLQGVAIYLEENDDSMPLRMHVISGKSNKNNEKIISSVQTIDDPAQIHPKLRGLFLEYEKLKSLYNSQFPDSVHPKTINFLAKYSTVLQNVPIYWMKEKFSFRRADMRNVEFSDNPAVIIIKARANSAQFLVEGYLSLGDVEVPIQDLDKNINPVLIFHNNVFYLIEDLKSSKLLQFMVERPTLKYSKKNKEAFFEHIHKLSRLAQIKFKGEGLELEEQEIAPTHRSIHLSESGEHLFIQPLVTYEDGITYKPILDRDVIVYNDGLTMIRRDEMFEKDFVASLSNLDPDFSSQANMGFFYKHLDRVLNTPWLFELYRYCKENDIQITGFENLEKINYNPIPAVVNINLTSGIDWFEGEINVSYGDQSVELKALREAILSSSTTVKLSDGTQGLLPEEWIERLSAIFRNGEVVGDKLLISKMKFNLIDSLFDEINDEQLKLEIDYRKRLLLNFDNIEEVPLPATVTATMRPYQLQGFYWLKFLDDFGFGGCLADDMGLGKTLQVLTFLAYKKEKSGGTTLVVLPKSLLFNWEDEIKKFCPSLTYTVYHGNKRKLELRHMSNYDLVLSTYGTVTNDIEDLMDYHFSYVVLDESQAIKNPTSKRYKAMRLIKSDNKIVMTGTPIENQTFDLYAQFNFINPGFFGSSNQFRMHFAEPIDVYGNEAVSLELRKLVKPFLLRRTKEQVAKDLPPKTESVLFVEMDKKQRVIYDSFVQRYKEYVSKKIDENGIQKSKMFVIEALLKLRQICNSPALLNEDQAYPNESIKIEVLMDHLSEIIGHHKVLVISQFTSMLALIKEKIEAAQIPYSYLDGSTTNRKEVVDTFNNNEDYRVFLLSLKAGGVGLNLASADYVFLVDPWWNPAAESQAIDRAHRIGQDKHVFAYRMICKDSIEEKIQVLQQRKKKMATDIIQVEESFIKSLTQDDIMALFS